MVRIYTRRLLKKEKKKGFHAADGRKKKKKGLFGFNKYGPYVLYD